MKDAYREAVLLHNLVAKRPSIEDFRAFDGAHCRRIYARLPEDWRCPSCLRTKFEILRWTTLYPHKPEISRPGWAGGYHEHHDHAGGKWFAARFEPTVICEQCNSADSAIKRKLKLPAKFSFSPIEIQRVVTSYAHGKHLIDYQVAHMIYASLYPFS
ncbi:MULTISPECIES: hypothetical protein [unclassified Variovorax]|uniref:hypothetical protein n=1 Tax=unclassified Variovorax TaxID=663243 RepID=UPI003F46D52A